MSIFLFIIVLVGLILVHELGHFLVAKSAGVKVEEFGIFFPPKLWGKKIGETEYTLNLWPIGGFVRIFGESPSEEAAASPDRTRALFHKPKWVQAAVLIAGVFFNVLAAWFLFVAVLMVGMPSAVSENSSRPIENPQLTIAAVLPHSPAAGAALQPGDVILGISSARAALAELTPEAAAAFIATQGGEELVVTLLRGSEELSISLVPTSGIVEGEPARAALGISMGLIGTLTLPFHLALWEGLTMTVSSLSAVTVGILGFLASAFTLSADLSQVAGPVGIVSLVGDAAELGLISLLLFTAFISLHLAVINLLPIPALDGGRLLFVIIEAVKGSPIRPVVANALNALGFALLILLMLVVTYSDILRLIT